MARDDVSQILNLLGPKNALLQVGPQIDFLAVKIQQRVSVGGEESIPFISLL